MKKEKAFTLIELLIVILIIGILAAMAIPKLFQTIDASRCSRSVKDIQAINSALILYSTQNSSGLPTTYIDNVASFLSPTYLPAKKNPWNYNYEYEGNGKEYTIYTTLQDSVRCKLSNGTECDGSSQDILYPSSIGDVTCG